jgi:hypothetical protein
MDIHVDTSDSLAEIRARIRSPIAERLAEISHLRTTKTFSFVRSLKCLSLDNADQAYRQPKSKRRRVAADLGKHKGQEAHESARDTPENDNGKPKLYERTIDISFRDYVAVSYTWSPSDGENAESGGYERITDDDPPQEIPCSVRDTVLGRVWSFANYVGCSSIWIDKECIDQQDKAKKEAAIQSMDIVYSLSDHPVALLSRKLESEEQIEMLVGLIDGSFVRDGDSSQAFQFQLEESRVSQAPAVVSLLDRITSDTWWSRAWTFQEDYKSSIKMTLLLPHVAALENCKAANSQHFSQLQGEVCLNSADFRRASTEYCLAYQTRFGPDDKCLKILRAAGKYNVLLREPGVLGLEIFRSMSPTIFDDIGRRNIEKESDRLAIAANCCSYPVRLDTEALKAANCSLSLSMLALYLLNGEIMDSDGEKDAAALSDNIFGFLKRQSLDNFRPPIDEELTFIKHCRLIDVELTGGGILTSGHLWRAGPSIRAAPVNVSQGLHSRERSRGRRQLQKLGDDLQNGRYGPSYTTLAEELVELAAKLGKTFPLPYKDHIASELPAVLEAGRQLHLACLTRPGHNTSPYRALFLGETGNEPELGPETPKFFFTGTKHEQHEFGSIDRHVSLEVEWKNRHFPHEMPHLIVKHWINGLFFPGNAQRRQVLLPWPASLAV